MIPFQTEHVFDNHEKMEEHIRESDVNDTRWLKDFMGL